MLDPIHDASFSRDRKASPPNSQCYPHTRRPIIDKFKAWALASILENPQCHIQWLYGYVGCGKSAIAQTLAEEIAELGKLAGSFFFFRGADERNRIAKLPVTLAYQLSISVPATEPWIRKAVMDDPTLLTPGAHSLRTRMTRLVYVPFMSATTSPDHTAPASATISPYLFVIDGLDECVDHDQVEEFVEGLLSFFECHPTTPLRFLISSRVEQHIQRHLQTDAVSLEDLVDHAPDADIALFLRTLFKNEAKRNRIIQSYGAWPSDQQLGKLIKHIGGSFIFASSIARYILGTPDDDVRLNASPLQAVRAEERPGRTPMDRLNLALRTELGLDGLYHQILTAAEHFAILPDLLVTLTVNSTKQGWSISSLAARLCCKTFEVTAVLVALYAIVQVPKDDESTIAFFHRSLHDFLKNEKRSGRFSVHHITRELLTRAERLHRHATHDLLVAATFLEDLPSLRFDHFTRFTPANRPVVMEILRLLKNYLVLIQDDASAPHFSFIPYLSEFTLDPTSSQRFCVSPNVACKEALARVEAYPRSNAIVTSLVNIFSLNGWVSINNLPVFAEANQDEIDSVLRCLRPVIAYDPKEEVACVRRRFVEQLERGGLGFHPEPLDDIYMRALVRCEELEKDYLSQILGYLLQYLISASTMLRTGAVRLLDFPYGSHSVVRVIRQLYPLVCGVGSLVIQDIQRPLRCRVAFVRFLLDEDRAGRFHVVLRDDQLKSIQRILSFVPFEYIPM